MGWPDGTPGFHVTRTVVALGGRGRPYERNLPWTCSSDGGDIGGLDGGCRRSQRRRWWRRRFIGGQSRRRRGRRWLPRRRARLRGRAPRRTRWPPPRRTWWRASRRPPPWRLGRLVRSGRRNLFRLALVLGLGVAWIRLGLSVRRRVCLPLRHVQQCPDQLRRDAAHRARKRVLVLLSESGRLFPLRLELQPAVDSGSTFQRGRRRRRSPAVAATP